MRAGPRQMWAACCEPFGDMVEIKLPMLRAALVCVAGVARLAGGQNCVDQVVRPDCRGVHQAVAPLGYCGVGRGLDQPPGGRLAPGLGSPFPGPNSRPAEASGTRIQDRYFH